MIGRSQKFRTSCDWEIPKKKKIKKEFLDYKNICHYLIYIFPFPVNSIDMRIIHVFSPQVQKFSFIKRGKKKKKRDETVEVTCCVT